MIKDLPEKIAHRIKLLYNRVQAGLANGTTHELEQAKTLLDAMCAKYGIKSDELLDFEDRKDETIFETWIPENYEKEFSETPFQLLAKEISEQLNVRIFIVGMVFRLYGEAKKFKQILEFALKRRDVCMGLKSFIKGKKKITSYRLGFAFGFGIALAQKLANEAKSEATSEAEAKKLAGFLTGESAEQSLSLIKDIDRIDQYLQKIVAENPQNFVDSKLQGKIEDMTSYTIGLYDGMNAYKNLLN